MIAGGIELEMERAAGESPWLKSAHTATERAEGIVRQLLQFSRRGSPTRAPIDLVELARETVSLASETFDRRIDVRLDAPKRLPPVIGDRGQLHQVLMNLLVNARDAVTERVDVAGRDPDYRPAITVALTPRESATDDAERRVELVVRDNGSGIPREVQDRIFDPFFTTKEIGQGTGLGLSTAYGIVADHGGTIEVRSEPDQGATFVVLFPSAAEAARDSDSEHERAPPRRPREASVLVVDDEPDVVRYAQEVLRGAGLRGGGRDERRRGAAPRGIARL